MQALGYATYPSSIKVITRHEELERNPKFGFDALICGAKNVVIRSGTNKASLNATSHPLSRLENACNTTALLFAVIYKNNFFVLYLMGVPK